MKFTTALSLLACAISTNAFAPMAPQHQTTALHMAGVLAKTTGRSALDPAVIAKYRELPFPADKVLAEYVWVDAAGNPRSKTRTLPAEKVSVEFVFASPGLFVPIYPLWELTDHFLFFDVGQEH